MPPRRRAPRTTARKSSLPSPDKCSGVKEEPATLKDAVLEAEFTSADAVAEASPVPENSAVGSLVPINDASLEAGVVEEVAAPLPQNYAVLFSSSETLAQSEKPVSEEKADTGVGESDKDNNNNVNSNINSNAGKTKKVVKKTVKVVKKVVKKVPKRVSKGETDVKVEDLEGVSNPNSMISSEVVAEGLEHATDIVQLNRESSNLDASTHVKMEEDEQKIRIDEKIDGLEGLNEEDDKGSSLMEADNNEGGTEAVGEEHDEILDVIEEREGEGQDEKGDKGCGLREVDNNEGGPCNVEERRAENMDVAEERGGECGKDSEDLVEGKGGMEWKEEEQEETEGVGNVVPREGEGGEGKLFRGELEAMERRKRRKTEIFIGGLDKDTKEEDIRKVFAEAGEIVDISVVNNTKTGKEKAFAFVRYASAADARRALEKFANVEISGKQCRASPVEGNDTIFLGNIDKKWKDEDVLQLLQQIGIENIDKVTVMIDPKNTECNRGFAFVELETCKDAQIAYRKLQKKDVFGKNRNVKVAWAEPLKELDEEEMLKVKTVYAEIIPLSWDEEKVRDTFKKFGEIDDVVLARNLRTTKRKDFAFISYKTREAAIRCIESFSCELKDGEGAKANVKVSLAKPVQKSKKSKPLANSAAKEVSTKKPNTSHSSLRLSEPRNRAQPIIPHYDLPIAQRSSTNAELVQLLREQASWRPAHVSLSNSPANMHYSTSLSGRKRQFSMLDVDPLYRESGRPPYSHMDASFPVANSSHNLVHHSGPANSVAHFRQHSGYPSGSRYGAMNYRDNNEVRDRARGSNSLYHRY